jgi:hypothetical protein
MISEPVASAEKERKIAGANVRAKTTGRRNA